jgi:hypothetical protein
VVVVALVLFLVFDAGFRPAPDTTMGGPDEDFSAPITSEETAPTTQEN